MNDTATEMAAVLAKARDVLAERGWHQGGYVNRKTGAVCLYGAVNLALGKVVNDSGWEARSIAALALLAAGVPKADSRNIGDWNDATYRTYEDVILSLKRAEELAAEMSS